MSLSLSFSVNEPSQLLTFDRRSNTVPRRFPAPGPPVCPRVSSLGTPDAPSSAARVPGSFCPPSPSVAVSSPARTPAGKCLLMQLNLLCEVT